MDTGKIMMGTALLLITIGLLVHPAGAAESGTTVTCSSATGAAEAGSVHGNCTAGSFPGSVSSGIATHPYERLNLSPGP